MKCPIIVGEKQILKNRFFYDSFCFNLLSIPFLGRFKIKIGSFLSAREPLSFTFYEDSKLNFERSFLILCVNKIFNFGHTLNTPS